MRCKALDSIRPPEHPNRLREWIDRHLFAFGPLKWGSGSAAFSAQSHCISSLRFRTPLVGKQVSNLPYDRREQLAACLYFRTPLVGKGIGKEEVVIS